MRLFRSTLALALLAGSCLLPQAAGAQINARQGVPAEEPPEFTSPMILELPFAQVLRLDEGFGTTFPDVNKFVCDDVNIDRLLVTKVQSSAKKGDRFALEGSVTVRESHDKTVNLDFEIYLKNKKLIAGWTLILDAEEKRTSPFKVQILVPAAAIAQLKDDPKSAVLKVTVKVAEEDW
jgi:hypothetical protein